MTRDGNEKEKERKGTRKEEKRDQGKGGELMKELKMGYVSSIVKLHYWQPYRLAP